MNLPISNGLSNKSELGWRVQGKLTASSPIAEAILSSDWADGGEALRHNLNSDAHIEAKFRLLHSQQVTRAS